MKMQRLDGGLRADRNQAGHDPGNNECGLQLLHRFIPWTPD
jgi:hypothetical protein